MSAILDEIRKAINASGKSRYAISRETGISENHLCQMMSRKRGLSVEALEKLAENLGLEITLQPRRRKGK